MWSHSMSCSTCCWPSAFWSSSVCMWSDELLDILLTSPGLLTSSSLYVTLSHGLLNTPLNFCYLLTPLQPVCDTVQWATQHATDLPPFLPIQSVCELVWWVLTCCWPPDCVPCLVCMWPCLVTCSRQHWPVAFWPIQPVCDLAQWPAWHTVDLLFPFDLVSCWYVWSHLWHEADLLLTSGLVQSVCDLVIWAAWHTADLLLSFDTISCMYVASPMSCFTTDLFPPHNLISLVYVVLSNELLNTHWPLALLHHSACMWIYSMSCWIHCWPSACSGCMWYLSSELLNIPLTFVNCCSI
jgi:hypothetical protein